MGTVSIRKTNLKINKFLLIGLEIDMIRLEMIGLEVNGLEMIGLEMITG